MWCVELSRVDLVLVLLAVLLTARRLLGDRLCQVALVPLLEGDLRSRWTARSCACTSQDPGTTYEPPSPTIFWQARRLTGHIRDSRESPACRVSGGSAVAVYGAIQARKLARTGRSKLASFSALLAGGCGGSEEHMHMCQCRAPGRRGSGPKPPEWLAEVDVADRSETAPEADRQAHPPTGARRCCTGR